MPRSPLITATAGTAVTVVVAVFAVGCAGGTGTAGRRHAGASPGAAPATTSATTISITPRDGARSVRPDEGVTIRAGHGRLRRVSVVDDQGRAADGTFGRDGTTWTTTWALRPDDTYTVTAWAVGPHGGTVRSQARFTTLRPARTVATGAAPLDHETVGIGMPIVVYLSRPVRDRAAVERSFQVTMSQPVEGAWRWISDKEVWFRPRAYWPAGEKVTFTAHLTGVRAGPDLYGDRDQTVHFTVGRAHITRIDARTHEMTVTSDGTVVRTIPVSLGKPDHATTSGIHIALEKDPSITMDSTTVGCGPGCPDYYRTRTHWNVRLTYDGEFVHSAPWSVKSQGRANVSHGCVNVGPANAKWFFRFTHRGDIIVVTGTRKKLPFGDGWTPWVLSWADWLKGSALHRPVDADVSGSGAEPSGQGLARPSPRAT